MSFIKPSFNTLHFLTSRYPFGEGETFVENELESLCREFKEVIIYPIKYDHCKENLTSREIPSNAKVITINQSYNFKKLVIANLYTFINLILSDFKLDKLSRVNKLKHIKYQLGYFICAVNIKNQLEKHLQSNKKNIYYSFWMHEGALALSILKKESKIHDFTFKCHGFDAFNEVHKQGFIPFRLITYKYAKHIITVSNAIKNYIEDKYSLYKFKLHRIYLGSDDYGFSKNYIQENNYIVFSCSNIIPLKRVEYIPKVLKHIKDINIHWYHAGNGIFKSNVITECNELPPNIRYTLMGRISHENVLEFYKNNDVNLFIHLSSSEGIGVVNMEAISFGVPVMACDVGGVNEIVNKKTGILLPKDFSPLEVADKIKSLLKNTEPKFNSLEIRKFWEENFDHKKNVQELIELLKT
ncbi:MAG: glycosyltransferase [Weeksellaceae bacterium]